MRQRLVITDLTQMPDGGLVCVVGVNERGDTIRPICANGFSKSYLYSGKLLIIRPKSIVEFDFTEDKPQPPHREDKVFDPRFITLQGLCDDKKWEEVLRQTSFYNVEDIFEGYLRYCKWVSPGAQTRSIATLAESYIQFLEIKETGNAVKPRLRFNDSSRREYDLPVSDLAIRVLCYKRVIRNRENAPKVAKDIASSLWNAQRLYLRIGLARPWRGDDVNEERCYLQVTGIHSFPDYLGGKTFADFI